MTATQPLITSRWMTRALDLGLITVTAPLWVPAMAALCLAVIVSSGRPVFFHQRRVGRGGTSFPMLKFRSMTNGDNPLVPDPARITSIGRLLRRTSLDELPQILNVVAGHMSLVGPRPMLPIQTGDMTVSERRRHSVRPGLTGLAQVNGRNALSWDQRFDYDLVWAANPSAMTYIRTLLKTVAVVLAGNGLDGHDATDRFVNVQPHVIRLVDFDLTNECVDDEQKAA